MPIVKSRARIDRKKKEKEDNSQAGNSDRFIYL